MSIFRRHLMLLSQQQDYTSYISDGLVFHLDGINKGPNDGKWTDLVGGVEFENHGATPVYDGWLFDSDGEDYLEANIGLNFPYNTHTIEIAYTEDNTSRPNRILFQTGVEDSLSFGILSSRLILIQQGSSVKPTFLYEDTNKTHTISSTKDVCLQDGIIRPKTLPNQNWGIGENKAIVGRRNSNSPNPFNGKIYSIRIYNRRLTEKEMRHNQAVDYERFIKDIGKTIIVTATTDSVDLTINNVKKTYAVTPNVPSKIVVDDIMINGQSMFQAQKTITSIDLTNFDLSKVTNMTDAFRDTTALKDINMSNTDTSKVSSFIRAFSGSGVKNLDMTNCNLGSVSRTDGMINYYLTNLKFGKNLKVSITFSYCNLTHESALSVLNGLAEVTTPRTVTFSSTTYNTLTEEEIALATSRGWTVASI